MVQSLAWAQRAQGWPVYNLSVSGDHTYFVGNAHGGVWAHNAGSCSLRLRHYTSKSASKLIQEQQKIIAKDQNRVFTELVKREGKGLSPRDAEETYGIGRGRGNAYVEFDADPSEVQIRQNRLTRATEHVLNGDVDLTNRNPVFY